MTARRPGGELRRRAKDRAFTLLALVFRSGNPAAPSHPARLLILQLQQIGDTIIFTPTLRALRRRFRNCRIDVVANAASAQVYRGSPHVDRLIVAQGWNAANALRRIITILSLARKLRRERYDCVVCDVTEQSFAYTLLAYLTGSHIRVGFDIANRGFLHTIRVPFDSQLPYVLCNLAIAKALGAGDVDATEEMPLSDADRVGARIKLAAVGIEGDASYAVIHPGSNWQSKTWYADRWARVADAMIQGYGLRILFVGTAAEASLAEVSRGAMRGDSASLVGGTTLGELAAVIARAAIFVGTDSGPRNIAGALGVPNVTVMSAQEDTDRWRGVRAGEVVVRADVRCQGCYYASCAHRLCMHVIGVEETVAAVKTALRDGRTEPARLETVPVPPAEYEKVAGDPDANCVTLRRLARDPM